jgi:hypothetical protein
MNIERWEALLRGLGGAPEIETFSRLQSAYSEKHRAYHTSRHIDECLALFDELKHLASHPPEVECALWFHDAIYEPMTKSNEERSGARIGRRNSVGVPVWQPTRWPESVRISWRRVMSHYPPMMTPGWYWTSIWRFSALRRVGMTNLSAT